MERARCPGPVSHGFYLISRPRAFATVSELEVLGIIISSPYQAFILLYLRRVLSRLFVLGCLKESVAFWLPLFLLFYSWLCGWPYWQY